MIVDVVLSYQVPASTTPGGSEREIVLLRVNYPTLTEAEVTPETERAILEHIKANLKIEEVVKYVTRGEAIAKMRAHQEKLDRGDLS